MEKGRQLIVGKNMAGVGLKSHTAPEVPAGGLKSVKQVTSGQLQTERSLCNGRQRGVEAYRI